jgi:hypothetical protein
MKKEVKHQGSVQPALPGTPSPLSADIYVSTLNTMLNRAFVVGKPDPEDRAALLPTILISGNSETDSEGKFVTELWGGYVNGSCETWWEGEVLITSPSIIFTATAESPTPVLLTWTKGKVEECGSFEFENLIYANYAGPEWHFNSKSYRIEIIVRSWMPDLAPAPRTRFSWSCIAQGGGLDIAD